VRSDLFKKNRYNESFTYAQDYEFYMRMIRSGYTIAYDKMNITYLLRRHKRRISSVQPQNQKIFFDKIINDYGLVSYPWVILKVLDLYLYLKSAFILR